jgi:hypothetical protein
VRRTSRLLKLRVHERLLVTLVSGEAFDGLLWEHDGELLVFRDAAAVSATGGRLPVDGELILERSRVSYLQRPNV